MYRTIDNYDLRIISIDNKEFFFFKLNRLKNKSLVLTLRRIGLNEDGLGRVTSGALLPPQRGFKSISIHEKAFKILAMWLKKAVATLAVSLDRWHQSFRSVPSSTNGVIMFHFAQPFDYKEQKKLITYSVENFERRLNNDKLHSINYCE